MLRVSGSVTRFRRQNRTLPEPTAVRADLDLVAALGLHDQVEGELIVLDRPGKAGVRSTLIEGSSPLRPVEEIAGALRV